MVARPAVKAVESRRAILAATAKLSRVLRNYKKRFEQPIPLIALLLAYSYLQFTDNNVPLVLCKNSVR